MMEVYVKRFFAALAFALLALGAMAAPASADPSGDGKWNCKDDFTYQEDAQEFFESEGGPERDPHGLDHNNDGIACNNLPHRPAGDTNDQAPGDPQGNSGGDDQLPVTGSIATPLVGAGVAWLLLGGIVVWLTRRRRANR